MGTLIKFAITYTLFLFLSIVSLGQGEDVRSATGMPIPIGKPVIWGKVSIRGLSPDERKPLVFVTLLVSGTQVERVQTNDRGYYYFLRAAGNATTLIFEVNNNEVGREMLIAAGPENTLRKDVEIDWKVFSTSNQSSPGVISVKDDYTGRTPGAQREMERALQTKKTGKAEDAIKILNSIVDQDPKDFPAWTELGTAYFASDKFAAAEVAYNKAIELKPDFMLAILNLGKVQMSQKKYDAAVVTLTKGIQTDPNSADAFHYLGESYLQIRQGSRAVIAMNEAIRLAPNDKAELHLRLASLYNAAGAKPQAVNEYKLFLQKKPDYKEKDKIEKYIKDNS